MSDAAFVEIVAMSATLGPCARPAAVGGDGEVDVEGATPLRAYGMGGITRWKRTEKSS